MQATEFRILGPLEVVRGDALVALPAKPRALLAMLLVHANAVVSVDRLIDGLWGERPPDSAAKTLQVYVSTLRKCIEPERSPREPPSVLLTREPGYKIVATADTLDLLRFEALCAQGNAALAAGDAATASAALGEALALWRGPALAEFAAEPFAEPDAARLEERRLATLETRIDADLTRGRHAALGLPEQTTATTPTGVITFLLTDIERSTALWEANRATMATALERHDGLAAEAVAGAGGMLLKVKGEGDATFSVFRRASDAVAAALSLRHALEAEPWPRSAPVRVRIAVHTGEAYERDGDYFGPAVNRAARLRSLAAGGEILCSRATAELIIDQLPEGVALVSRGTQTLRDIARPEEVFALVPAGESGAARAGPGAAAEEEPRFPLPHPLRPLEDDFFVGRIEEVARLERALGDAQEGKRRLVLVGGEPGVGKTRLVAHVANLAHDAGATVLYGRCDEGLGVPYQPFVEALGKYLDAMPPQVVHAQAGDRVGELTRLLPELGRRPLGLSPPTRADPETERYVLFEAVVDVLAGMAAAAPLVLVIDDLHWASQPTLLLLEHLLRARQAGMLVLATYRDTEVHRGHPVSGMLAEVRRARGVERLSLSGLDAAGVLAFVQAAAGGAADDRVGVLADAIWEATGGNPFFVGEVIAHLVESGAVSQDDTGRWTAAPDMTLDRLGLPEGVRDVVTRRLSRLSETADKALTAASVIGPAFSIRMLELTADIDPDALLVGLEEAARAGLLREAGAGYTFAHALIRQTLYDELSAPRRMRMHRRVGEALEQLPDRQAHLEALAHHFAEAALDDQLTKAADYALAAGRKALDQAAYELAVAILERGLQVIDLDESGRDDLLARRCDLLIATGTAQAAAGVGAFRSTLLEAAAMARSMGDRNRLVEAALANQRGGRSVAGVVDHERVAVLEAALDAVGDADTANRAMLLACLAAETIYESDWKERVGRSDEALAIARRLDDPTTLAAVLNLRFEAIRLPSTREERLANAAAHLELAKRLADPIHIGFAASRRVRVCWEVGDVAEIRRCQRLIAPVVSLHSYLRYAHAVDEAMLSMAAGDLDEAEDGVNRAFEIARATDQPDAAPVMAVQLVAVRWEQGRLDEVVPMLERAVAENPGIPGFRAVLATAYCESDRLDEGRALVQRDAASDFAEIPFNGHWLASMAMFSHAAVAIGHTGAAAVLYDALAPWHDHLAYTGVSVFGGVADHYLGQLAAVLCRPHDAALHFDAAEALYTRMGAPTFLARTRLARARLLGTPAP